MSPAAPRINYKKPSRINAVSLTLLAILATGAYLLYALWPVYTLRAKAKGELEDAVPRLYRANLLPDSVARPEIIKLRTDLLTQLRKVGVTDKKLEVIIDRNKKRVGIEARFSMSAHFPWLEKRKEFRLAPRAETDAARVEW